MRRARELELMERIATAGPTLAGLHGPESLVNSASVYTNPERFRREQQMFREGPVFVGLSCELAAPGSWLTATFDGIPLVLVRQDDGSLRALVNACRHRGAPLVEQGERGDSLQRFACPYHGWVYGRGGRLQAQPNASGAFDQVTQNCDLHRVAVAEKHGLIFVRPGSLDPIDVDAFLCGAEHDLGDFRLENYVHIESRTHVWPLNWKLVVDTFTEAYHVGVLHRTTLGPTFDSNCQVFDTFGPHALGIGLRKKTVELANGPREDWALLPWATIQYFLMPSGLVVHQVDHIESWRIEPIDAHSTRTVTSVFAPEPPHSERSRQYFVKNLDLLLRVTGEEDFALMAKIQKVLESGALPEVIYGRNENVLVHLHQQLNARLGGGPTE